MQIKKNLIAGEWCESDDTRDNVNPSNLDDVIAVHARANQQQCNDAIAAAVAAQPGWLAAGIQKRSDVLDAAGTEILARKAELGELLSREEGKTLPEGIGEVTRAGQVLKFFAGEALRQTGDLIDSVRPGVDVTVTREPVGVVGIITPWNFPIAIPAWKIAPALAFGNAVVFKPAELVPGSAWALIDILHRAGVPAGVLNLVNGPGSVVGKTLVEDSRINAISFTGSVPTGRGIAAACGANLKKVQLEMGGKNPLVVLDDADLNTAVECAVNGAYFSTGQRCTASSRLIVSDGIHDRFIDALETRLKGLVVGDALKDTTHIGPVVDQSQLDQNLSYLKIAADEGATLRFGGNILERETRGYFMEPALFTETRNDMRINQEEVFGPVASVVRVSGYDEALSVANDTEFGLSAGVVTTSLRYANDFRARSQAGMVMINLPTAGVDYHVPFGGRKGSSYGSREQGRYAVEFYTTVKTGYISA